MSISSWKTYGADYLEYGARALALLPLSVAALRWRGLTRPLRVLAVGLGVAAVLLGALAFEQSAPVEALLWHLYTVTQTLFVGGLYAYALRPGQPRAGVPVALGAFVGFALFDWLWLSRGQAVHPYTHALQSVLLVALAVLYLRQLARELPVQRLELDPVFLISSGVVMYFSATLLFYVLLPSFVGSVTPGQRVGAVFVSLVSCLQSVLFALAFYRASGPHPLPSSPRLS